jgi:hypothetical protein
MTAAAHALVDAYSERERIAGQISAFASAVGRVRPGDVSRSRCEELVHAASALLHAGGEEPPVLTRDPRKPRYGKLPEQVSA